MELLDPILMVEKDDRKTTVVSHGWTCTYVDISYIYIYIIYIYTYYLKYHMDYIYILHYMTIIWMREIYIYISYYMIHYHFLQCDTRICRIGVSLGLDMVQNRRLKATAFNYKRSNYPRGI